MSLIGKQEYKGHIKFSSEQFICLFMNYSYLHYSDKQKHLKVQLCQQSTRHRETSSPNGKVGPLSQVNSSENKAIITAAYKDTTSRGNYNFSPPLSHRATPYLSP